ncbi:Ti-type conjugative transfer relaxase TraA [Sphingomonas paeninsulae]|uniref:Ti-type conjugative transfer relaxase TraA n=1 Tax=Sphingomonas paeninsulae TaxID=2319844 RepID=A0A494TL56_SPHPE|nr:Ti-type conjugative transfer relaxase TraA [Sphingomonas paeninsulae]AYJ86556.1 Ti-type conjugative transfer relaxase TraA [Sphingomonas paeninsulae]
MAIYHFSAKVISRAAGSSALAAAAYRSASRLHDQRLDRHHDFSNKAGVVHSEVMLPDGAAPELSDRENLWNAVELAEKRIDAQLAREIEFALPRELSKEDGIALARDFIRDAFVSRGMIADLNVHWDIGADGEAKPHAHVMLTMREISDEGFGPKVRDWNATSLLEHWRESWAARANQRLAELDIEARIDHRSFEAQGIELEPQPKMGPAAARMAEQGLSSERVEEQLQIARENGVKIIANPAIGLDAITRTQATFTRRDLAIFVHRHSEDRNQFDAVTSAMRASPDLVALGKDGRGEDRFTSRAMIETEQRLERATTAIAERERHGVGERFRERAISLAGQRGMVLSGAQHAAFDHVTQGKGLGVVIGYAGTGKSAMLGVAREAWEGAGYNVRGLALSGIAAENLEGGSGIASRTIASLEHQWAQGRDLLTSHDVLVIDEAGMIGSRQMERVISAAEKRGTKVVLVGDPEQLQAIEAGAAFRSIAERHGAIEITEIRRQREDWQRDATRHLATGRTGEAVHAYDQTGHVHAADTRDAARADLIERWDRDRIGNPEASRIILTHTNGEVRALNDAARERLRAAGELGEDMAVHTERGANVFARGDRVMFLKNERSLGVKNGTLATIQDVTRARMAVLLDDGRAVAFDIKDYAAIDHGYAATVHKTQGVTVDRTHVLATPGLDAHATYVALSRHRDSVDLHYGRDDFADTARLVRTLSRERAKDMASDYTRDFAERRQIRLPAIEKIIPTPTPEKVRPALVRDPFAGLDLRPLSARSPAPTRGTFDGLKLQTSPAMPQPATVSLDTAVQRFARATADIVRMRSQGYAELEHQKAAYEKAAAAIDRGRPDGARDLRAAFMREEGLMDEAAKGRPRAAIRAMALEAEMRVSPQRRADRFVEDWQKLAKAHRSFNQAGNDKGATAIGQQMSAMGKSLECDAQAESLVRKRLPELGIRVSGGASISQEIQDWLGLSRSRGIGR